MMCGFSLLVLFCCCFAFSDTLYGVFAKGRRNGVGVSQAQAGRDGARCPLLVLALVLMAAAQPCRACPVALLSAGSGECPAHQC